MAGNAMNLFLSSLLISSALALPTSPKKSKSTQKEIAYPHRLGYTSSQKILMPAIVPAGELKMMEKRHHHDHDHDTVLIQPVPLMSHDPIYGTWMGQEWRSAYYDPSHSRHWNFKHGFTNYDGVRYVTVPIKAKRDTMQDSPLVARSPPHTSKHHKTRKLHATHSSSSSSVPTPSPTSHGLDVNLLNVKMNSKRDLPVAVPAAPAPPQASQKEHKKKKGKKPKKGKKKPKKGGKRLDHEDNEFMKREETVDPGRAGFVEIASPFFANPQIQTGVSGLTTSTDPEDPSRILLATSNTHSTQFWLSKVDPPPSNMTNPNESIAQLRLPVLSSTTMQSKMECATFGVEPPTKLILTPCGESNSSYSQNFLYNSNTGELKPYYDVAVIAVPNNSTSNTTESSAQVVKNFLSTSSGNSSNSTNSSNPTTVTATVSLYWIPASAFFADSASSSSTSPSSTAADSSETPVNAFVATPTTVEESKITEMPSSSAMESASVASSTDSASAVDSSSVTSTSTMDSPTSTSAEIPTMTSSSMASALPSAAAFIDGGDNSSTGSDDGSDAGNVDSDSDSGASPASANQLYKPTSTDDLDPTNVKVGDSAEQSQDYQNAQEDTDDVSEDVASSSVP